MQPFERAKSGRNLEDNMRGRALVGIGIVAAATLLSALPAAAAGRPAGVYCVGDSVTISWTPPADATNVSGYFVEHTLTNDANDGLPVEEIRVGRDRTSVVSTLQFGLNVYLVWAVDDFGHRLGNPIVVVSFSAGGMPFPMTWDPFDPSNRVGDGTATVTFGWNVLAYIESYATITGNEHDTLVISGAGRKQSLNLYNGQVNVRTQTATFSGLTDGQPYTFTSDVSNACGDGGGASSGVFVPGIAPAWTANTPPLIGHHGMYKYQFGATGKPAPTYQLVGAPSWLSVDSFGRVSGHPPKDITQFSYSVVARNGVGLRDLAGSDITAGPFMVTMRSSLPRPERDRGNHEDRRH
jgi:hypothetical protein